MSRYVYEVTLTHPHTGVPKRIGGYTKTEVQLKAAEQLRKWGEQEARRINRERINDLRQRAIFDGEQARMLIDSWKGILRSTLGVDDRLDWERLKKKQPYESFTFSEPILTLLDVREELGVPPKRALIEALFKGSKRTREEKEAQAETLYQERVAARASRLKKAELEYERLKTEYLTAQAQEDLVLDDLRADFEAGHADAIEKYVHMVLETSAYPEGLERDFETQLDLISGTLIVSFELPKKETVPSTVDYRFAAARSEVLPVPMKPRELDVFYENVLFQICLRTIHEVFESVYIDAVSMVVFNGWVSGIDARTGRDFRSCILSCAAHREDFEAFNLERVDPRECFRALKGVSAGPLASLGPVRPILDIRRDDRRFVESRAVAGQLTSGANLAVMLWEDFEHLVRELLKDYSLKMTARSGSLRRVVTEGWTR